MTDTMIHLIFKTHLDIGFTNLAGRVTQQYHEHFIPQALETGEHFHAENPEEPKFIWTTGAWLIADYLDKAEPAAVRRMERAIERGLIRWHALPFTTHTELMSPALFRAGLSFGQMLDRRFGMRTTAAKMTDVPGHTRGMVPLLADAGVQFLHLGVNEASPVPDVPEVFRWRVDGREVVVMYQNSYGGTHFPQGSAQGLSFAHTNDNAGPQTVSQTVEHYRVLQARHPGSAIKASTLDAYGDLLWAQRQDLPVIEHEIGDSWIYGAGSDPTKVRRFLGLQRLYDAFEAEGLTPERQAFGRRLTMVPEHTWGVDIKTFLRDETAWSRGDFDKARHSDPRFSFSEASWAEQRAYLDAAVEALAPNDIARAEAAQTETVAPLSDGVPVPAGEAIALDGWQLGIDAATGDVVGLASPAGIALGGAEGSLIGFRYESYDAADIATHLDSYLTKRPDWAILDHAKPGLEHAGSARSAAFRPKLLRIARDGSRLLVVSEMPADAVSMLGAPRQVELLLEPVSDTRLDLTLLLRDKPANRMPEAGFLQLALAGAAWQFRKLGLWNHAEAVVSLGGGQLQAIEAASAALPQGGQLRITPLDTPLAAPIDWPFMVFNHGAPDFGRGLRFNLHNNKWGTNFPMWWEGDLLARFSIEVTAA